MAYKKMRKLIYWLKRDLRSYKKKNRNYLMNPSSELKKEINENYNFDLIDTNKNLKWIKKF